MPTSKICREHAVQMHSDRRDTSARSKAQMFFDMAKRWTYFAINTEGSEALADPASPPANDPGEPYRFGSRIGRPRD